VNCDDPAALIMSPLRMLGTMISTSTNRTTNLQRFGHLLETFVVMECLPWQADSRGEDSLTEILAATGQVPMAPGTTGVGS
jgi:hypothetical protein